MTTLPAHNPKALPKLNFGSIKLSLALLGLMLVYPFVFGGALNWGITTLILAGVAMAWNVLGGWAGQESFGHAVLLGIGAYTMTLLAESRGLAPWWGALAGMALAVALSLVWGGLTFRLRGAYFTLSTIAVSLVLRLVAINEDFTGGAEGKFVPDLQRPFGLDLFDRRTEYWLVVGFVALTLLVTHLIRRSRLGFALLAVREDEDSARALGINPARMKLVAFAISAALTALGGSLYAVVLQAFEPHTILELALSIKIALIAIIGGRFFIQGPIVGALFLEGLGEGMRRLFSQQGVQGLEGLLHLKIPAPLAEALGTSNLLIYGVLVIVVTLFAPRGLMGLSSRGSRQLGKAR